MRYFFHNVYGETDDLIASAPADVQCVPFGWTIEVEQARNTLLVQLGAVVSRLPCLLYWKVESTMTLPDGEQIPIPAQWAQVHVDQLPKPWSWDQITAAQT